MNKRYEVSTKPGAAEDPLQVLSMLVLTSQAERERGNLAAWIKPAPQCRSACDKLVEAGYLETSADHPGCFRPTEAGKAKLRFEGPQDHAMPRDSDCLHCNIWPVIHRYCEEHPQGCLQDVFNGLTDVIGDMLSRERPPDQEEYIRRIDRRMRERIREAAATLAVR
jgi:hypothetical protein